MEKIININIEKLPENVYLATSDELEGLVAQGRTIAETIEIARDVARVLLELRGEPTDTISVESEKFSLPIVVGV